MQQKKALTLENTPILGKCSLKVNACMTSNTPVFYFRDQYNFEFPLCQADFSFFILCFFVPFSQKTAKNTFSVNFEKDFHDFRLFSFFYKSFRL